MARNSNQVLVPQARQALENFKFEIANEVAHQHPALQEYISRGGGYGGDVPAKVWGSIGGQMVKRMIEIAEQSLAQQNSGQMN